MHFERSSKHIIDDIDNVTDTQDNDMVGRTWTMTEKGLSAGDGTSLPFPKGVVQRVPGSTEEHQTNTAAASTAQVKLPSLIALLSANLRL